MNCSPPGSFVHGNSQARILEWDAISSSGDLPDPGIESASPALAGRFFTTEPPGKPLFLFGGCLMEKQDGLSKCKSSQPGVSKPGCEPAENY